MRYILSLIVFVLLINTGQSQILLLMDSDSVTTVVGADITPPLPPTSYVAIGGTSQTQYVSTWTDPTATDLDSIRWYEGSSNDSTALNWIASIPAGTETYTRTGRSAGITYWSAVKAIDDSGNVSWFSNIDSATTTGGAAPDTGFFKFDAEDGLAHLVIDGSMTPYVTDTSGFSYAGSKCYKLRGNSGAVNVVPLAQLPAGSIDNDSVWVTYRVYIPSGSTTNETNSTYEYLTLLFNGIDGIGDAGDFGISTDESDNIAGWVKPFGTEVTTNFSTNAWHKIEIKYKNGTGTAQDSVWVDETLIYGTSSTTSTSQIDGLMFGYQSWVLLSGKAIYFDDIIFSNHRLPLD